MKPKPIDVDVKVVYIKAPNAKYSFALHLIKSKIDLSYIQEFLGYKSSKTTESYTHVSTKNLSAIKNPLDNLLKGEI